MNGRLRRWLESVDFVAEIILLEEFRLWNYPMITRFPNLENLTHLRKVNITGCKRLTDISAVERIPNLRVFGIVNTPQTVEDLVFIARKEGMEAMSGAFGSKRRDAAFDALLERYGLVYG